MNGDIGLEDEQLQRSDRAARRGSASSEQNVERHFEEMPHVAEESGRG
jgi:hypothetical protein